VFEFEAPAKFEFELAGEFVFDTPVFVGSTAHPAFARRAEKISAFKIGFITSFLYRSRGARLRKDRSANQRVGIRV